MIDYKAAGVDIDTGNEIVNRIKRRVKQTFSSNVLTDLGGFAGLYDLKTLVNQYEHPVLVQSIDGLGTKPIIAKLAGNYQYLGYDLLSATANDIIVVGAKPLVLLDYVASAKLDANIIETIINSMCRACQENDVSLIGGETAEMPGVYQTGEIDIAGIITGIVDKNKVIDGRFIQPGDSVYGLASSGLHTNGYSLARKLIFETAKLTVDDNLPGSTLTIGEALLAPHINYFKFVDFMLSHALEIKGMAHITGGGLLENVPRILPAHCSVRLQIKGWPTLPIFDLLKNIEPLPIQDLYRTFNMGIGYVLIIDSKQASHLEKLAKELGTYHLYKIGEVISGKQEVELCS
ncbi:MAG: phosphoribosylformylglycinamidine cyclo-ligase [Gammaproteobacteria bacterium RIFCSPHIGHO2_12_FULL_35_23]|nr:MAG: phosphoribosylformylglycinamidine cyclo-ligase [Gammaproteobacteria bacterium RIFCSPHIGHO2_12_FULL_35_23]